LGGRSRRKSQDADVLRRTQKSKPRLIEVTVETPAETGFALLLANGRRIESSWVFVETELMRFFREAEP